MHKGKNRDHVKQRTYGKQDKNGQMGLQSTIPSFPVIQNHHLLGRYWQESA